VSDTIHPLVAYGRARGNGSLNVRDAAHEAFHALSVNAKNWDREKVHAKLCRKFKRAALWLHELEARAVEQLVCQRLGYDCGPLDKWVGWSAMEAIKFRLPYDSDHKRSVEMAEKMMTRPATKAWSDRIVALVSDQLTEEAVSP
jgi:hypothetical protein